jgi:hypothetical protein
MRPSVPYFFLLVKRQMILLVNGEALQLNGLTKKSENVTSQPIEPYFFYLSNARRFYSSMGKLCSLMG